MTIPKYVQELMTRSRFALGPVHERASPGYTIWIEKATPYTSADTLRAECERLCRWAKRSYADAEILSCPSETHYYPQRALVTVTDPCMKHREQYISEVNK